MVLYIQSMQHGGKMKHFKNKSNNHPYVKKNSSLPIVPGEERLNQQQEEKEKKFAYKIKQISFSNTTLNIPGFVARGKTQLRSPN
eukprot:scaffold15179_cov73-Cylindrotheca_fusiformis.AAC.2